MSTARLMSLAVSAPASPEDGRTGTRSVGRALPLAVPQYAALCAQIDLRLEQVVARTGCIASFSLRSGNDMVCVAQKRASIEIAGMLIRVGTRRPIVASVAGRAVLQRLPPDVHGRRPLPSERHAE